VPHLCNPRPCHYQPRAAPRPVPGSCASSPSGLHFQSPAECTTSSPRPAPLRLHFQSAGGWQGSLAVEPQGTGKGVELPGGPWTGSRLAVEPTCTGAGGDPQRSGPWTGSRALGQTSGPGDLQWGGPASGSGSPWDCQSNFEKHVRTRVRKRFWWGQSPVPGGSIASPRAVHCQSLGGPLPVPGDSTANPRAAPRPVTGGSIASLRRLHCQPPRAHCRPSGRSAASLQGLHRQSPGVAEGLALEPPGTGCRAAGDSKRSRGARRGAAREMSVEHAGAGSGAGGDLKCSGPGIGSGAAGD